MDGVSPLYVIMSARDPKKLSLLRAGSVSKEPPPHKALSIRKYCSYKISSTTGNASNKLIVLCTIPFVRVCGSCLSEGPISHSDLFVRSSSRV